MDELRKLILKRLPDVEMEEIKLIQNNTDDFELEQLSEFLLIYRTKRKKPETFRQCTLLGIIGIGGIQRFYIGQIGSGIGYLLTYGVFFIGTILDLINYKKVTLERNQEIITNDILPLL